MNKSTTIKEYCRTLNLGNIASNLDQVILDAEKKQYSYLDYTVSGKSGQIDPPHAGVKRPPLGRT